ncbi:hypothetical protein [Helicobacter sp. T3_23-1059]
MRSHYDNVAISPSAREGALIANAITNPCHTEHKRSNSKSKKNINRYILLNAQYDKNSVIANGFCIKSAW